ELGIAVNEGFEPGGVGVRCQDADPVHRARSCISSKVVPPGCDRLMTAARASIDRATRQGSVKGADREWKWRRRSPHNPSRQRIENMTFIYPLVDGFVRLTLTSEIARILVARKMGP